MKARLVDAEEQSKARFGNLFAKSVCTTAKTCCCLFFLSLILLKKNGYVWLFEESFGMLSNLLLCSFNVQRFANVCS